MRKLLSIAVLLIASTFAYSHPVHVGGGFHPGFHGGGFHGAGGGFNQFRGGFGFDGPVLFPNSFGGGFNSFSQYSSFGGAYGGVPLTFGTPVPTGGCGCSGGAPATFGGGFYGGGFVPAPRFVRPFGVRVLFIR